MDLKEYASLDALGLAERIRNGEIHPEAARELALSAIQHLDPQLNAVIEHFPEAQPAQGADHGLLYGVPYLTKDLPFERGVVAECGSRLARGFVTPVDSAVSERLRAAGAVNVGRTTTSEFALAAVTENAVNGKTANPWNPSLSPAGSSGGSAAAVAAGMVPFALGSDGGGSIRMPASFCGLIGLKPSRGRVSCAPEVTLGYSGLNVPFVLVRSVRDAAVLLDLLEGPCTGDDLIIVRPEQSYQDAILGEPEPLRIGFMTTPWSGIPVDAEIQSATEHTVELCEYFGHTVENDAPIIDFKAFIHAQKTIWSAHVHADIEAIAEALGRSPSPETLQSSTLAVYERGAGLSSREFIAALNVYHEITRTVGAWFESHDVLITPTCTILPQPLGTFDPDAAGMSVDGFFYEQLAPHESFTSLFNCTGQPAISIPLYTSSQGLPLGIQCVTRFGDEATVLQLAGQLLSGKNAENPFPLVHASRAAS